MSGELRSTSLKIVMPAVFASLAVFMTLANLVFPFPILPYLRFELAEIPVIVVFLIMGPIPGLSSAVVYWGILNVVGEWVPIGPAMKLLSLGPTILGLWAGLLVYNKLIKKRNSVTASLGLSIAMGIIFRVLVTSLLNFVLLWYLFPFFLDLASGSIKAVLGLDISSSVTALAFALLFTALFNIIHTFLSVLPSYAISKTVAQARIPGLKAIWIDEATQSTDSKTERTQK